MLNAPIDGERPADAPKPGGERPLPAPIQPEGQETDPPLPRRALAYALGIFFAGIVSVVWFAPRLSPDDIPGFLIFAVLAIAFGRTRLQIYGDTTISVAVASDIAIAFLFGPAGSAIVSPFAALSTDLGGGAWYKRLFNIGSVVVVNVIVAVAIQQMVGVVGPGLPHSPWLIAIAIVAVTGYYLLNIGLVAFAVSLSTRTSVIAVVREKFEWLLPHYLTFGLLGLALAVAYDAIGFVGVLAFIAPPIMMRFSIKQYIDKTAANVEALKQRNQELSRANRDVMRMAEQLRATYDGTLEALVSALDARDRETKGHSLRVARYMMEIAFHLGVEPETEEWVDLQRGGLLHDIGKIGVSDTILHKPGPLTEDEWKDMRRHPQIGHDMIREIGFLSGAAVIVLAHHERYDGKGYPKGLTADEIPIGARIFVLADTFDAMTSDRPYRPAMTNEAARDEIIRCSGTQFDPRCVQAFLLAWDRVVEIRASETEEDSLHHAAAAPRVAA